MKATRKQNQRSGFTLIEMVGVLAVIAILAALLVPKIFAAIEESRYTNAVGSLNSVKAATMDYFSKHGGFSQSATFDNVLITAGYLETAFKTRIGTGWSCKVDPYDDAATASGTKFAKLDGNTATASGNVVYCTITGVNMSDAWELSKRLDGTSMSEANATDADAEGRVIYDADGDNDGKTDVLVYIAHK
jgi:prepilin-type N-terminal cleavage/methylation domain-containing protein